MSSSGLSDEVPVPADTFATIICGALLAFQDLRWPRWITLAQPSINLAIFARLKLRNFADAWDIQKILIR